jgi:chitodextrinase
VFTHVSHDQVDLSWSPSIDNIGVEGYYVVRNGITIGSASNTVYSDLTVNASTYYEYYLIAYDAAGNFSESSDTVSTTTPNAPDTEAPTAPANLTAEAVSPYQINLVWEASTDNIGVVGYDIYKDNIYSITVETTSFGDTNLTPGTTYEYFVIARDAAGNSSLPSNTAVVTTEAEEQYGILTGTVYSSAGGVLSGVKVTVSLKNYQVVEYTDINGVYIFPQIPPETYTARYVGTNEYQQISTQVTIQAGTTTVQNVTLVLKKNK